MFEWKFLDWVFPTVSFTGKKFILGNPLSQDVDIDHKGRIVITSPQWLEGVPITLSMISSIKGEGGPLLTPYPDWSWHTADCRGFTSVYRIAVNFFLYIICQFKFFISNLKFEKILQYILKLEMFCFLCNVLCIENLKKYVRKKA